MIESPFEYEINRDKTRIRLVSHQGEFHYSAQEISNLALFFANVRADMSTPVSDSFGDVEPIKADLVEAVPDPRTGNAEIRFRIPGLGWSFAELNSVQCIKLAEKLNPQASVAGYTAAVKGLLK
jgi:hypothetical protein